MRARARRVGLCLSSPSRFFRATRWCARARRSAGAPFAQHGKNIRPRAPRGVTVRGVARARREETEPRQPRPDDSATGSGSCALLPHDHRHLTLEQARRSTHVVWVARSGQVGREKASVSLRLLGARACGCGPPLRVERAAAAAATLAVRRPGRLRMTSAGKAAAAPARGAPASDESFSFLLLLHCVQGRQPAQRGVRLFHQARQPVSVW